MTKSKEELHENFLEWTTYTRDRFLKWVSQIDDLKSKLDWTPESLQIIENYLLEHFSYEDILNKTNNSSIDAIISYVGDTIRINIPEMIWEINIDDKSDVYFNLPCLRPKLGVPTSPHDLIKRSLGTREIGLIKFTFDYHVTEQKEYEEFMRTK
jgi:hypothetical protein